MASSCCARRTTGMLVRCLAVVAVTASVLTVVAGPADAGLDPSGELDTTFDTDGFNTTNFAQVDTFAEARGVGFQTVGANAGRVILAGGYQEGFNDHVALLRLNSNGTQDMGFGTGGEVKTVIGTTDISEDVVIQPDDKIVVGGWTDQDFLLLRYLADGGVDSSFGGGDGYATAGNVAGQFDRALTVALQSDGKILMGGYSYDSATTQRDMSVMRFTSAGVLDTSFGGGDGKAIISTTASTERVRAITMQSDGKILLAGHSNTGTSTCNTQSYQDQNSAVLRLNSDGSLDTTFSGDGIQIVNLATITNCPDDGFRAVTVQSDGKIVAAGGAATTQDGSTNAKSNVSVARFNSDGSFDNGFDSDGRTWTAIAPTNSFLADLAEDVGIDSGGKIVAGAYSTGTGNNQNFAALRYNTNGSLDTSFSGDGIAVVDFGGNDAMDAMSLDSSGRPILAGYSYPSDSFSDPQIAAARLTTAGVLDTGFDGDGSFFKPLQGGSVDSGSGVAVQRLGADANKVVVAGTTDTGAGTDVALVRYTTAGALDNTFDSDGRATGGHNQRSETGRAIAVDAADKILVAGDNYGTSGAPSAVLLRFNANGSKDSPFGTAGTASHTVGTNANAWHALAIQPDGKIVVGGTVSDSASDWDFFVARYTTGGALDTSFDGDGWRRISLGNSYDEVHAVAVQPDGKILIGGFSFVSSAASHFAMVRLNANGSSDTSFDGDGTAITPMGNGQFPRNEIRAIVVLPDGRIVAGGKGNDGGNSTNNVMRLVRYQSNGALDTTFGTGGKVTTNLAGDRFDELSGLALQHDQKLVAFGHSMQLFVTNDDFALARFNWDDGSLDTTFGSANAGYTITAVSPGADRAAGGVLLARGVAVAGGTAVGSDIGAARYKGDPAPVLPGPPDLAAASDTGLSSTDNITKDNTPDITGSSCNVGETTILKVGGSVTNPLSRALCRTGSWSVTATTLPDGVHTIGAFSRNGYGDTADTATLSITVDTVANPPALTFPAAATTIEIPPSPIITGTVPETIAGSAVTVREGAQTVCTATANAAGNWSCQSSLGPGAHTITATQTDVAGNTSAASAGLSFTLKTPTTTVLTTSVDPSVYGQAITYTATVTAQIGTPDGQVAFAVDGGAPTNVALSSGVATLTVAQPPNQLAVGTHAVTAGYAGSTGYYPSNAALSPDQTVNKAGTTTALGTSTSPSAYGEEVTFTATVAPAAPGAGTPTGSVVFSVPGQAPVTVALANGVATLKTAALAPGTHGVSAAYGGDANFNGGNGSLDQVVNPGVSATQVVSSLSPSGFGEAVTFTATVSAVAPAPGAPTGSVDFVVDGGSPVTVALSGGQATLSSSTLGAGAHTVAVSYGGDTTFAGSTGTLSGNQTVNKGGSVTSVVSSANPSTYQQPVTFTVTVAPTAPATETPTGDINLVVDGGAPVVVTLAGGSATVSLSTLGVGSHTVQAAYVGSPNYNSSTSALSGGQTVNQAASVTSVVSSANPSAYQQDVTFTITVAPVAPATEVPTGNVNVAVDGGAPVTIALANGTATLTRSDLAVGAHPVEATYGGNGNFATSTGSLAGDQVVAKALSATSIVSSLNPSTFQEEVSFTVTVSPVAPATDTPEGTVDVVIDGGAPVTLTLSGGTATLNRSDLPAGGHAVEATYVGNDNYATSTATLAGGQAVEKAATATAVASSRNPSTYGQEVGFTITVTPVAPATAIPGGAVEVVVDGGAPVTVALTDGQATLTMTGLAGGDHTVTGKYLGDANFTGSTANLGGGQHVDVAPSALTVTSDPNPSDVGQTVTFIAKTGSQVSAFSTQSAGSGPAAPTGKVSFSVDGGTPVLVTLNGGAAVYQVSALAAGNHTVTVSYPGDANYAASSAQLGGGQQVNLPASADADPGGSGAGGGTGGLVPTEPGGTGGTGGGGGGVGGTGTGTGPTGAGRPGTLPVTGSDPGTLFGPALALVGAGLLLPLLAAGAARAGRRRQDIER